MPCFQPLPAWRTPNGEVYLAKEHNDAYFLRLPCGGCLGCRMARAKEWALRCQLELQHHATAVFTTVTYSDKNLPPTLQKEHVSLWLKRLRKHQAKNNGRIRYFACGEYGEANNRPHYHAILYGMAETDKKLIENKWGMGYVRTSPTTPARIAYAAGYTSKKIGYKLLPEERVDPETGEVYTWQPPFIQMSRNPGIGAKALEYIDSWREYAIYDGNRMPVPRYYHEAWKKQATREEIEELQLEKIKRAILRDTTKERLEAAERIAESKQKLSAEKRKI